jgi:hypothetical protein
VDGRAAEVVEGVIERRQYQHSPAEDVDGVETARGWRYEVTRVLRRQAGSMETIGLSSAGRAGSVNRTFQARRARGSDDRHSSGTRL